MNQLLVEVWSDIVCPFCYIGKKNYELALSEFNFAQDIKLEFKSYMLDPNFEHNPEEKYDLRQGLANKYGKTLAEVDQMQNHIIAMAQSVGLTFDFQNSYRFNTMNAHRILHKAKEKNIDTKLTEAFFSAYLEKGLNLAKIEVLKKVAQENGMLPEEIDEALTNDLYAYKVQQDLQEAAQLGISGVPFFVFNRKYGVSGAQPKEVFLQTMQQAHADWKNNQPQALEIKKGGAQCDIDGNCH